MVQNGFIKLRIFSGTPCHANFICKARRDELCAKVPHKQGSRVTRVRVPAKSQNDWKDELLEQHYTNLVCSCHPAGIQNTTHFDELCAKWPHNQASNKVRTQAPAANKTIGDNKRKSSRNTTQYLMGSVIAQAFMS